MGNMVYLISGFAALSGHPNVHPFEGAARSEATLPAGWPIRSNIFVVDKMDVVMCDGRDTWYRNANGTIKSAAAGQPISALF